ncbi:Ran exchange factor Prp20/Pim1 [Aspergillus eucalypticola CBS 122712]|uniref:Ran exchange factor Prp20/Pim1 n=1 Tax=Aspergillus eucalypticola (strain CBS 122712 / IBT 29274) TaxID=1448314 RepID=A0A317VYJ8_ASPEC|nr:Ran exchange factor Prp20/Pim1 [Aspergillus eucalypticola CBS 122712]PWY77998.1 Ran exchange factor Prp20/Pim1 [Aspergillus eucalypticola CBS 122712]
MPPKKSAPKPAAASAAAAKVKQTTATTTTTTKAATKANTKTTTKAKKTTATTSTARKAPTDKREAPAKPKKTTKRQTAKSATAPKKGGGTDDNLARKKREVEPAKRVKRKAEVVDEAPARDVKKARVAKPRVTKPKPKVVINHAPTTRLNVYVCGEGSSGELGLGSAKNAVDVKRPRLNANLPADRVGVVQVAVGGMHCVALTYDNKILTWGVNDQGALGRDTTWDGGYKDMDKADNESDSDSDDDIALNPHESIPTAIPSEAFPKDTVFVEVAAGDSSSFALTDDGQVYGWGTFRSNDGILGFDATNKVQLTPSLIPSLKKIKHLACGDNHVLALNEKGAVFSWGSGQQNQLGRRIIERNRLNGLQPREFGLPKNIVHIGCGAFHSFAVHQSGEVYAWGLNSFGETGIRAGAGDDEAAIVHPTAVESLSGKAVTQICGGAHHSLAIADNGECLVWGRLDGYQTGLKIDSLPEDAVIKDERGRPRILIEPKAVPGVKANTVAAGSDHSLVIDVDGRPWSWGFSATYQTGQGTPDDIEIATVIENTAVRGKKLNWAGGGGQFSVFTEPAALA